MSNYYRSFVTLDEHLDKIADKISRIDETLNRIADAIELLKKEKKEGEKEE